MYVQARPLFLYGTLTALPLLAWAVTGDARKISVVEALVQPAYITGYVRLAVRGRDYPGVIKHDATSMVDGLLFTPQTRSQRTKLDDFEGEAYKVTPVQVTVAKNVGGEGETVDADVYLWNGDADDLSHEETWDLDTFTRERLDDWLDLFGGMELVGDDEQ